MELIMDSTKTAVAEPRAAAVRRTVAAALRALQKAFDEANLPPRHRGRVWQELLSLLHYLTVCTEHTIEDATAEEIQAWLEPARGLSDFDVRQEMLGLVSRAVANPNLHVNAQPGSPRLRRLKEKLFFRRHHTTVGGRTAAFFEAIRQEDIDRHESTAEPYYQGYIEVMPETGLEPLDTDQVVVRCLRGMGVSGADAPAIVDIGCGRGRLLRLLATEFPRATLSGTDLLPLYFDLLRTQNIQGLLCHAGKLALPDASQDVVVSTDVIEHLRHPEEMVSEVRRVLRPGGRFCIGGPSSNSAFYGKNPLSYLMVALGTVSERFLPPYHNLYAPMTPLKIVHYGFTVHQFRGLFRRHCPGATVRTTRFHALRKFRLHRLAPRLPVLRMMGDWVYAFGRK